MSGFKWWMRLVGLFYLLLGIGFVPVFNEARPPLLIPAFAAPPGSIAYKALIGWTCVFELDLLAIGAVLIYAARDPVPNIMLAWLVIWLELIRGMFDDLYYLSRGYASIPLYVGFIAVHLVIIATGIRFIRQAQAGARATPAALSPAAATGGYRRRRDHR